LLLVLFGFLAPGIAFADPALASSRPACDLLGEALKSIQLPSQYSCHVHCETLYSHQSWKNAPTSQASEQNIFRDGNRLDIASYESNFLNGQPKAGFVMRDIWSGVVFLHRQQSSSDGIGQILASARIRPENQSSQYCDCLAIDGQPYFERKPLVQILSDAGTAENVGSETIRGFSCIILQGKTDFGTIELWLDPDLGYLMRKAALVVGPGDSIASGTRLPIAHPRRSVLGYHVEIKDIEFEKLGDSYIAVKGQTELKELFSDGYDRFRQTLTRSRLQLQPDFTKARAFVLDGVRDGMPLQIIDRPKDDHFQYIFKNGTVVKDEDSETTRQIDQGMAAEREKARQGDGQ